MNLSVRRHNNEYFVIKLIFLLSLIFKIYFEL